MIAYRITNLTNGATYIGITRYSLARRWAEHVRQSRQKKTANVRLSKAIRRYGAGAFSIVAIAQARSWIDLQATEILLVAAERAKGLTCYNMTPGGDGGPTMSGRKLTPEQIERLSKAKLQTWASFSGERRAEIAAKVSAAHKACGFARGNQYAACLKGRPFTETHRANLAAANRRRAAAPGFGQAVSDGLRKSAKSAAYHAARKGMPRPGHGPKITAANFARWAAMTPEKRAEIAAKISATRLANAVHPAMDKAAARVARG